MVEIGYLAVVQNTYKQLTQNLSIYKKDNIRKEQYLEAEYFTGAFLMMALGLTIASLCFICEILLYRYRRQHF